MSTPRRRNSAGRLSLAPNRRGLFSSGSASCYTLGTARPQVVGTRLRAQRLAPVFGESGRGVFGRGTLNVIWR
jgi:hypothetical protein